MENSHRQEKEQYEELRHPRQEAEQYEELREHFIRLQLKFNKLRKIVIDLQEMVIELATERAQNLKQLS
jgi:hypothetical protein